MRKIKLILRCTMYMQFQRVPECLFNFVKKFSDLPGYFRSKFSNKDTLLEFFLMHFSIISFFIASVF